MEWTEILALVFFITIGVTIWVINIRWTFRFWRKHLQNKRVNSELIEIIHYTNNDSTATNPEPQSIVFNKFNKLNQSPNTEGYQEKRKLKSETDKLSSICIFFERSKNA